MKLLAFILPIFLTASLIHCRITLDTTLLSDVPISTPTLFEAKRAANLSFASLGTLLGREEVAVAALFYGQAAVSGADIATLSSALALPAAELESLFLDYPNRGGLVPMPPTEPLIYRLYEIVMVYGYAYKAVINEMFGDGIMSAISFSTRVERDGERGSTNEYVVITMRGRWLPFSRF